MTSITIFLILVPVLAVILLAVNLIFAPHSPYQEKDSVFECGFHSFLGQNRTQFSISFFIFGILFLLFDLEILLLYPYGLSIYLAEIYGLAFLIIFFLLLTAGFAFELGKNALKIDSRQHSSRPLPEADSRKSFASNNSPNILQATVLDPEILQLIADFMETGGAYLASLGTTVLEHSCDISSHEFNFSDSDPDPISETSDTFKDNMDKYLGILSYFPDISILDIVFRGTIDKGTESLSYFLQTCLISTIVPTTIYAFMMEYPRYLVDTVRDYLSNYGSWQMLRATLQGDVNELSRRWSRIAGLLDPAHRASPELLEFMRLNQPLINRIVDNTETYVQNLIHLDHLRDILNEAHYDDAYGYNLHNAVGLINIPARHLDV